VAGVAFDALGTLFDLRGLRPRLESHFGHRAEEVFEGFTRRLVPFTWHLTASGRFVPMPEVAATAFRAAAREAGVALGEQEAAELAGALTELPPYPDVDAGLAALEQRPLAVLSNGTGEGVASLVRGAGLAGRFDHLLSVEAAGRYKPAPEAYALAIAAFSAEAQHVVLVSAHEWDVAGAQAAGLRGALVARDGPPVSFLGREPDLVVDDLTGLGSALERLEAASLA